jgi:hypothetical protein
MKQNHRNQILAIEELMSTERERMEKFRESEAEEAEIMFSRAEKIKRGEMERRKAIAGDNVARIRLEVSRKIRNRELEWQGQCLFLCLFFLSPPSRHFHTTLTFFLPHSPTQQTGQCAKWLQVARRKVQVKSNEDAAASTGKKKRSGGK